MLLSFISLMKYLLILIAAPIVLFACQHDVCTSTDWDYNNPRNGGFQKVPFCEQETAPGMILIEGGKYHIPNFGSNDTLEIASFYISKYEETNGQYMEYLQFVKRYYSEGTYRNALPDTTVWNAMDASERSKSHFVNNYLRDWTYKDYPVVGLSPEQIRKYASWKTDRINEMILIREGVFEKNRSIIDSTDVFSTEAYFNQTYSNDAILQDLNPDHVDGRNSRVRAIRMEDGLLLPKFRLPTETEWQHAHLAIGDSSYRYRKTEKPSVIKLKDFRFLDDVEFSSTKSYPPEVIVDGLQKVHTPTANVYYLKGLNSNVSECVGDSVSVGIIGGSFLVAVPDNVALYDMNITNGIKYHIEEPLQEAIALNEFVTKIYGFRLSMDRVGGPSYGQFQKRRYRYKP